MQGDPPIFRHVPLLCPTCGYRVDASENQTGDGAPIEGDFTLCFDCGALAVYTAGARSLRVPTQADMQEFEASAENVDARRRLLQWIAAHPRPRHPGAR